MPKISKADASWVENIEGTFEGRFEDLGGYTAQFEHYLAHADPAELFRGLPGDRCQCPHWGVVLRGRLVYRYADGSEDVVEPGEAYYAPPGHLPVFVAGTEIVEFSPTEEFRRTAEAVLDNAAARS